jgi:hypothetical protein
VHTNPDDEPELADRVDGALSAGDRARRAVEGGEEAVASAAASLPR